METTVPYVVLAVVIALLMWRLAATERAALADAAERERQIEAGLARAARIKELEAVSTAASDELAAIRATADELRDRLATIAAGPLIHRRVIASIAGDEGGVDGILTGWVGDWARFEAVQFIAGKGKVEPVDGAVYVPRGKIIALHEPPAEAAEAA